jgi:hypothetical protein
MESDQKRTAAICNETFGLDRLFVTMIIGSKITDDLKGQLLLGDVIISNRIDKRDVEYDILSDQETFIHLDI